MKLIYCQKCQQLISLIMKETTFCSCHSCAGKYLADNMTAVVSKDAIVVGIDNNSFCNYAVKNHEWSQLQSADRIDLFFSGWVPNWPGEVIVVENTDEVINHDFEPEIALTKSTSPTNGNH